MVKSNTVALFLNLTWLFGELSRIVGSKEHRSYPINVEAFENETLILPCDIQEQENDDSFETKTIWWKDGRLIADTRDGIVIPPERYVLLQNSTLIITGLTSEDAGEFKCEIIRPDLAPVLQVHSIKVLYPPTISTVPSSGIMFVDFGKEVDIACETTGYPTPIIRWNFEGELMELLDNRPKLIFNASSYNMSGTYECVANNGIGPVAKGIIKVLVRGPPRVKAERHWVHTGLGLRAKLVAWVDSIPAARGEWHHEGVFVRTSSRIVIYNAEDDSSVLMIRNVRATDLGVYTFKAQNSMGMESVAFKLSAVAAEAEFTVEPKVNNATMSSFTLKWQVFSYTTLIEYNLWFRPYKPKPEATTDGVFNFVKDKDSTWTKLTIPVEDNDGPLHIGYYTIHGLKPDTVYEALITSRNKFGWSKPSTIIRFSTTTVHEHRHTVELFEDHEHYRRQTPHSISPLTDLPDSGSLPTTTSIYSIMKKTVVVYNSGAARLYNGYFVFLLFIFILLNR